MGTQPLSLFMGRASGPFSAVCRGLGGQTWLDRVGLRPWVSLNSIPLPVHHRAQARASLLFGAAQPCLPFTPPHADSLLSSAFSRVRVRYQKRQKLQFETKLGMNSPF